MNTVVWYDSDETGAPTLNNVAGSAIGVLDACLVNGFNAKSVTSLVVASGVATATISAHGYGVGRMVEFAGATPSGLNGRKKILSATNNTVTFDATGITDQTATGTITAKRSPLGWAKTYAGTNKAAYSRTDPAATAMMLRVVDDGTSNYWARAVMYETMSDVDTGTGSTYTSYDGTGGHYIYKGVNDATAKKWILIGDGKTLKHLSTYYIGKSALNRFRSDNGYKQNQYQKIWAGEEDNAHMMRWIDGIVRATGGSAEITSDDVYAWLQATYPVFKG
jgi:hypothetical protein